MQLQMKRDKATIDAFLLKLDRLRYDMTFEYRENNCRPLPYNVKRDCLAAISVGNMEKLIKLIDNIDPKRLVSIHADETNDYKMYMMNLIFYMTDAAIEGGTPESVSYMIRDAYLKALQAYDKMEHYEFIVKHAAKEFTKQAYFYRKYRTVSPPILQCINYIQIHLHQKITIADLAKISFLSERHLTRKFKAEMGFSIQTYIQSERIQSAKLMLVFSSLSILEISQYLSFCSESHFCSIFKKHTGLTPSKYRTLYKRISAA